MKLLKIKDKKNTPIKINSDKKDALYSNEHQQYMKLVIIKKGIISSLKSPFKITTYLEFYSK